MYVCTSECMYVCVHVCMCVRYPLYRYIRSSSYIYSYYWLRWCRQMYNSDILNDHFSSSINYTKLSEKLNSAIWDFITDSSDINYDCNKFLTTIRHTLEASKTLCKIHPSKTHKKNPWITVGLINSCNTNNKLY